MPLTAAPAPNSAAPASYDEAMQMLGREIRPGQRELVEHGVALRPGRHLLVKAPTATGKTIAALMIAGLRYQANGDRTIVATYTRILQDQYADKDLTDAATLFPDMPIAILKGASNYVCRTLHRRIANERVRSELEHGTGDPGEIRHHPEMWPARADSKTCKKHDPEDCGYAAAKKRAAAAACVITNHALVLLHGHEVPVLGEHDLLIVDEIHNFPRAAESFGTVEIDFVQMADEAIKDGDRALADLFIQAQRCIEPGDDWENRTPTGDELTKMVSLLTTHPARSNEGAEPLLAWCQAALDHKTRGKQPAKMATVAKQQRRWPDSKRVVLATDIDVSVAAGRGLATTQYQPGLDEDGDRASVPFQRAVLMMSATTGTPEHPTHVAERCGLPTVELLEVSSALDYPNQMRVSLIDDAPASWSTPQVAAKLIEHTAGRTLVLCRSWRAVRDIHAHLSGLRPDYQVHIQNSENPTLNGQVVQAFRQDETSVLVGTASLFEGIDVAGPSLSQVIIVDLPMIMAFDPLGKERQKRAGQRWFPDHQIPGTALVLEQMMGRLIRRVTDRGLIAILDKAATRTWGATATRHAMASFGLQAVPRGVALRWYRDSEGV